MCYKKKSKLSFCVHVLFMFVCSSSTESECCVGIYNSRSFFCGGISCHISLELSDMYISVCFQYILSGSDDFNLYMWRIPSDPEAGKHTHTHAQGNRV